MQIRKNSVASVEYTLTNPEGQVLDSSKGRGPLSYIHGSGNIIPGLESALEGKQVGDSLKTTVAPAQGYGERDPGMVQAVPRGNFQGVENIAVGMQFYARSPQGTRVVTVMSVDDENVTVDANHPLAGVPLTFDVTVVDVREATEEELAHGHLHGTCENHGEGGCESCGGGCGGGGGHEHE